MHSLPHQELQPDLLAIPSENNSDERKSSHITKSIPVNYKDIFKYDSTIKDFKFDILVSDSNYESHSISPVRYQKPLYNFYSKFSYTDFIKSVVNRTFKSNHYLAVTKTGIALLPEKDVSIFFKPNIQKQLYIEAHFTLNEENYFLKQDCFCNEFANGIEIFKDINHSNNTDLVGYGVIFQEGIALIIANKNKSDWNNLHSIVIASGQLTPLSSINDISDVSNIKFVSYDFGVAKKSIVNVLQPEISSTNIEKYYINDFEDFKPIYRIDNNNISLISYGFDKTKPVNSIYSFISSINSLKSNQNDFSKFHNNFVINIKTDSLILNEVSLNANIAGFPHSIFFNLNAKNIFIYPKHLISKDTVLSSESPYSQDNIVHLRHDKQSYLQAEAKFYGKNFDYLVLTYDLTMHISKQNIFLSELGSTVRNWGFHIFINSRKLLLN